MGPCVAVASSSYHELGVQHVDGPGTAHGGLADDLQRHLRRTSRHQRHVNTHELKPSEDFTNQCEPIELPSPRPYSVPVLIFPLPLLFLFGLQPRTFLLSVFLSPSLTMEKPPVPTVDMSSYMSRHRRI